MMRITVAALFLASALAAPQRQEAVVEAGIGEAAGQALPVNVDRRPQPGSDLDLARSSLRSMFPASQTLDAAAVPARSLASKESMIKIASQVAHQVEQKGEVNITSVPNPLGGHSRATVALTFHAILAMLTAAIFVGYMYDKNHPPGDGDPRKGRPFGSWLVGMIGASYVLLFPGIFSVLVSYNVFVELHFKLIFVPFDVAHNMTEEAITETMASLIDALFRTGGWLGGVLVTTYAIILPLLKIGLLLVGERWRHSPNAPRRRVARYSIIFVQHVSKWASPDMFAYIMIEYLLRNLGHPPEVMSKAALDVGFICFSVFCVSSTFSSICITPPLLLTTPEAAKKPPKWAGFLNRTQTVKLVWFLTLVFVVCLGCGVFVPCMGLRLSVESLLEPNGPVPRSMEEFLRSLHLEDKVKATVTPVECIGALMGWASAGEAPSFVAFVLLTFFVLLFPALDMLMSLVVLFAPVPARRAVGSGPRAPEMRDLAQNASWVLHHVAMLDVFCVGCIVVCLAGAAYKKMGIDIELRHGIVWLLLAEAAHMIVGHLVEPHDDGGPAADTAAASAEDRGDEEDRRKLLDATDDEDRQTPQE